MTNSSETSLYDVSSRKLNPALGRLNPTFTHLLVAYIIIEYDTYKLCVNVFVICYEQQYIKIYETVEYLICKNEQ